MNDDQKPLQIEIDQIALERKSIKLHDKLLAHELKLSKEFGTIASRLHKISSILKNIQEVKFDSNRNMIQMLHQKTGIITKNHKEIINAQVPKLERRSSIMLEASEGFKELESSQDEYTKSLKNFINKWGNLVSDSETWAKLSNDFDKARGTAVAGGKLDKIEKNLAKYKKKVIKEYESKFHQNETVQTTYSHVNSAWIRTKGTINKTEW